MSDFFPVYMINVYLTYYFLCRDTRSKKSKLQSRDVNFSVRLSTAKSGLRQREYT